MSFDLVKGEAFDLGKENPSLKILALGGAWDVNTNGGDDFDLDIFAIPLKNGTATTAGKLEDVPGILNHICYFNNKSIHGMALDKDNRTGAGDGDDETIRIELDKVPAEFTDVILGINIYNGTALNQRFSQIQNAQVRLYNSETNVEIAVYKLREDYKRSTAVVVGRLYRGNGGLWEFEALGVGTDGDILAVANQYK